LKGKSFSIESRQVLKIFQSGFLTPTSVDSVSKVVRKTMQYPDYEGDGSTSAVHQLTVNLGQSYQNPILGRRQGNYADLLLANMGIPRDGSGSTM
jgi:hypothetical protein